MDILSQLPPGMILVLGSAFIPLIPRKGQGWAAVLLTFVSAAHLLLFFQDGDQMTLSMMGLELMPIRVDRLSLIFGYVFHIAAVMSTIYALYAKKTIEHVMGIAYAGAAIGAVFSGDLISLFIFWELTALTSVFLIWAADTEEALHCGVRYLVIQVASGVILFAGTLMHYNNTGSLDFVNFYDAGLTTATTVILWAIAIKAAFPFLHNWLQDAYPKATYSGTVFLSAFTTKLAIYALARGYAGFEFLIPIGCVMTVFPIFFAVIENDLRKVLAYSLNNQLGFMVIGIGIGSALAIDGACAHAFAHIIYKGLLFMSMGAVLYRVGSTKATDLGGLYRTMPLTTLFCIVGAMSISAFPLLSGFAAKSLIASAAGIEHYAIVTFIILFASAGVMEHSGIKIPFFAFFAHDSGKRPKEAPWNMLLAMGIAAVLCIGIGVYPTALYQLLPNYALDPVSGTTYNAYDVTHVLMQLQLLLFAALAFGVLVRMRAYPSEERAVNLDFDWVYRKALPRFLKGSYSLLSEISHLATQPIRVRMTVLKSSFISALSPRSNGFGRDAMSSDAALWAAILLVVYLFIYYV